MPISVHRHLANDHQRYSLAGDLDLLVPTTVSGWRENSGEPIWFSHPCVTRLRGGRGVTFHVGTLVRLRFPRPADFKTSLTTLEPARSIDEAAGLEDIPSSFVGARFCTLDDSALKTSRHCYLKSCWNTGLQGEAGPKRRVLDHEGLSHWHSMLMAGNRYIETVGAYRTHEDAMQIVSGRLARPKIHLELPRLAGLPLRWSASL